MKSLIPEEAMLITLRDYLYEGSWDKMAHDLRDRSKSRPVVTRLARRIKEDLARIRRLRAYEEGRGTNLAKWLAARDEC